MKWKELELLLPIPLANDTIINLNAIPKEECKPPSLSLGKNMNNLIRLFFYITISSDKIEPTDDIMCPTHIGDQINPRSCFAQQIAIHYS